MVEETIVRFEYFLVVSKVKRDQENKTRKVTRRCQSVSFPARFKTLYPSIYCFFKY